MDTNDKIIKWLKITALPYAHIAKKTGISRATLHNWVNGSHHIRKRNKERILLHFKDDIQLTLGNTKLKILGGKNKMFKPDINENLSKQAGEIDANYVIDLQKNEISRLNREVRTLSDSINKVNTSNKNSYDEITEYEIESKTKMNFRLSGVTRTMLSIDRLDVFGEKLGYKLDEFSCYALIGEEFKMFEHPIENLLHKDSTNLIMNLMETLPKIYDIFKGMVGNHYIPIGLSYIHKDGHLVHTMNYCSVNWSTKIVSTKTTFLA
jgi:hypothetical protein